MPGHKKKRTTPEAPLSTSELSFSMLPEQQEFHQCVRTLARRAIQPVIEDGGNSMRSQEPR